MARIDTMTPTMREALKHDKERHHIERVGVSFVTSMGTMMRTGILKSYVQRLPFHEAIDKAVIKFTPIYQNVMLLAYLQGRYRSLLTSASKLAERERALSTTFDKAILFLQRRMDLSTEDMAALKVRYGENAVNITRNLGANIEGKVNQTMGNIVASGAHVQEGVGKLKKTFDAAGITPKNPFLLETLMRTNVQMAYSAGRWEVNQDPAIQEILWGYEYVTVGDDRVRDNHAALDGTKLPKNDPQWAELWPPNGFNCRCTTLEIFNEEAVVQPTSKTIDGKEVSAIPDKGWNFNPGQISTGIKQRTKIVRGIGPKPILRPKVEAIRGVTSVARKSQQLVALENQYKVEFRSIMNHRVAIDLKGVDVGLADDILRKHSELLKQYKFVKINKIKSVELGSENFMAWNDRTRTLFVNKNVFKSRAKFESTLRRRIKDTDFIATNIDEAVTHEFGHIVHSSLPFKQADEATTLFFKYGRENITKQIGTYASSNQAEMFAEAFLQMHKTTFSPIARDIMSKAGLLTKGARPLAEAIRARKFLPWRQYATKHAGKKTQTELLYNWSKLHFEETGQMTEWTRNFILKHAARFEAKAVQISKRIPGLAQAKKGVVPKVAKRAPKKVTKAPTKKAAPKAEPKTAKTPFTAKELETKMAKEFKLKTSHFSDIDDVTANEVYNSIKGLKKDYSKVKFRRLGVTSKMTAKGEASEAIAVTIYSRKTILLNSEYWDKSIRGRKFLTRELGKSNKKKFLVGNNPGDVINHEFGHLISRSMPEKTQAKIASLFYETEEKIIRKSISRYAAESPGEFFSEAFVALRKGKSNPLLRSFAGILKKAKIKTTKAKLPFKAREAIVLKKPLPVRAPKPAKIPTVPEAKPQSTRSATEALQERESLSKWQNKLPVKQQNAIKNYVGEASDEMVEAQRLQFAGKELQSHQQALLFRAMEVEDAIASAPSYTRSVWRGMRFKDTTKGRHDYRQLMQHFAGGKEFTFESLTSFAAGKKEALEFAGRATAQRRVLIYMEKAPKRSVHLEASKFGRLGEREVLVGSGGRYKVTGKSIETITRKRDAAMAPSTATYEVYHVQEIIP